MSVLGSLKSTARLTWGLHRFLRHPLTRERCVQLVREALAQREENFLSGLERNVFCNQASPFRALLELAGCEMGDVRRLVQQEGLEGALGELRQAGVYLTYEEFKGKREVVRGNKRLRFSERDFDNPSVREVLADRSGGSRGPSVSSPVDLRMVTYQSTKKALLLAAHGLHDIPTAFWLPVPPDTAGFKHLLYEAKLGLPPVERWFSPTPLRGSSVGSIATAGMLGVFLVGRTVGRRFPWPQHVSFEQADVVARWVSSTLARAGGALLRTRVGAALEVVKAARRENLDLTGAFFLVGGEPFTEARAAEMASAGVRSLQIYGISELGGGVAQSCASPVHPDDMHLFTDVVALIRHRREHNGLDVEPFLFTSLHPLAPKVLLNVESDDCGEVEERTCGCLMEEIGLTTHLHHVRSFGKLTTQGRNVLGSDLLRIVEEVLPAAFGGSSVDYQILEEEEADGNTRLSLLINPDVGELDPDDVIAAVIRELKRGRPAYEVSAELWRQGGSIAVRRERPRATWRGKVLPLHYTSRRSPG